jgi:hypothetical protein
VNLFGCSLDRSKGTKIALDKGSLDIPTSVSLRDSNQMHHDRLSESQGSHHPVCLERTERRVRLWNRYQGKQATYFYFWSSFFDLLEDGSTGCRISSHNDDFGRIVFGEENAGWPAYARVSFWLLLELPNSVENLN